MVAFLGNPGKQYEKTRHNLGWLCLENISLFQNLQWKSKFKGEWANLQTGGVKQIILKPDTYMNKSGESIGAAAAFFKIKSESVMIVHDDIEIPFGTWQVKKGGGLGGHNGLRSIHSAMGKKDYYRLRLGVGRPSRGDVASHVLGRFTPQEEAELNLVYPDVEKILRALTDCEPDKLKAPLQKGKIHN